MTNLEVAVSKGLINSGTMLCRIAYICKYNGKCHGKECYECELNKNINLCVQTLLKEYKEPIKLKQWEYDLLKAKLEYYYGDQHFNWYTDVRNMKEKGYFKGITDTSMTLREILDNCEVIEDGECGE